MREIALARGKGAALVDDEDFDLVSQYKWHAFTKNGITYAVRREMVNGVNKKIRMHRMILLDVPLIDHADGCGLNNTRANLRPATKSQNAMNAKPRRNKRSPYKGVSFSTKGGRGRPWLAQIQVNGVVHHLGFYTTATDGARAYDAAAVELFGEFAKLNFPIACVPGQGAGAMRATQNVADAVPQAA